MTNSLNKEQIQVYVLLINLLLILQWFRIFSTVRNDWLYEELIFWPLRPGPWLEFSIFLFWTSRSQTVAAGAALKKQHFPYNNLFNNFNYDLQMEVFLNCFVFLALNLSFISPKGVSGIWISLLQCTNGKTHSSLHGFKSHFKILLRHLDPLYVP